MQNKNRGFTLVELLSIIIVIGFIAAFSFTVVSKKIKESKEKLYDKLIIDIEEAGKKYMNAPEKNTDKYHINTICLSIKDLQDAGHLEKGTIKNPINKKALTGSVQVTYDEANKQYKYKYVDNCTPTDIIPFSETILTNEEVKVINGSDGLYENTDSYVFRGTNPNNYVRFNNSVWRIIGIDKESNRVKIINLNGSQHTWQQDGMIDYLNNDFTSGTTYSEDDKEMISNNSKWNNGKVDTLESSLTLKSIEKQSEDFKTIGLLTVSEYVDASLDKECYLNNTCSSYLSKNSNYYLYNNTSDNKTWYVKNDNKLATILPTNETLYNVYPVLYLNLKVMVTNGNGTELSPYEIQ